MTDSPRSPGLIERYQEELQVRHYARRTVSTYTQWIRRFLRFHRLRHPREMGSDEVEDLRHSAPPMPPGLRLSSFTANGSTGLLGLSKCKTLSTLRSRYLWPKTRMTFSPWRQPGALATPAPIPSITATSRRRFAKLPHADS